MKHTFNDNEKTDKHALKHVREEKLKKNLHKRLKRVEGQIRGIEGMIEKDAYCNDVLNQIAAARAALDSISKLILGDHIKDCLVGKTKTSKNDIVDELLITIGKML